MSLSKIQCIQASFTSIRFDPNLTSSYMASPFGVAILLTKVDSLDKVLPPNSNSFVCLGNWSQEHLKAHRNKYQLQLIIDVSLLCVVGYDRSKSIMAMLLHMNLRALFMTCLPISMFKISMMLSRNAVGAIFETEHISPSLMCCEIQGVMVFLSAFYL